MIRGFKSIVLFLFSCFGLGHSVWAQINFDSLLSASPRLKQVAIEKEKYHLQIIYSRVIDSVGQKKLQHYSYNCLPNNYLYCASLIKLPVAVLCLKKFRDLGLDIHSVLLTDSSRLCHRNVHRDSSSLTGWPSIAHYIRKMMLVSDNEAYNRCFEFLGTEYIHHQLAAWSYPAVRIVNRYEVNCSPGSNTYCNPIRICDKKMQVIYEQKEEKISEEWTRPVYSVQMGKAYRDVNNNMVKEPKDFSYMNFMSLEDSHRFLVELLSNRGASFGLSPQLFEFLELSMSQYPGQSLSPVYKRSEFPDTYKKYLYFKEGQDLLNDSNFVSTNVVGLSYGFISDCARITDHRNGFEFYLSAGLYLNDDGILNDGIYEYHSIGRPFLTELGNQIHKFERLHRQK